MALTKVSTPAIKDEAITLAKLLHGDSNSNGKFLRANNGADPTFETIDLTALSASNLTSGTLPDARFPATLPAISGANLTNLPVQASISSNANHRLFTGGGGSNLIGQQHLTFDGAHLILGSGKGIKTNFIRHADGSNTNTGNANQQYWKIGEIGLNGSEGAVITLVGANGYSGGSSAAGETTIVLRGSNTSTLLGFWYSETPGGDNSTYSDVRWKHISGINFELWVSAGPYNNVAPALVKTTGSFNNTNAAGTGSNNPPSGSTALPSSHRKKVGSIDTIEYQSTGTIFKKKIYMASGEGIYMDGGSTDANYLDDYEEGNWTPVLEGTSTTGTATYTARVGKYVKIGKKVLWEMYISFNSGNGSGTFHITGLPFTVANNGTYPAVNIGYVHQFALRTGYHLYGLHASGSNYLYFYEMPDGGGANLQPNYDGSGSLIMSGHYEVT